MSKPNIYVPAKDKYLTEAIQRHLQDAQFRGMSVGAKTMCSAVIKKLEDVNEETTKEEMYAAIEAVRTFCGTALGMAASN